MLFPTLFPFLFDSGEPPTETYDYLRFVGEQTLDEVQFRNADVPDATLFANGSVTKPDWDDNTILLMHFENNLDAGNFPTNDLLVTEWRILRRKFGELSYELIDTTINENINKYYDIYAQSGVDYEYAIQSVSNGTRGDLIESEVISVDFWGWRLLSLDFNEANETGTMYSFIINNETSSIPINRARTVYENNFSQYPKIEYGRLKYRTGSITTIPYSDATGEYVVATNEIRESLEDFINDEQPKILKNGSGLTMKVDTSNCQIKYEDVVTLNGTNQQLYTFTFDYIEIGVASGA